MFWCLKSLWSIGIISVTSGFKSQWRLASHSPPLPVFSWEVFQVLRSLTYHPASGERQLVFCPGSKFSACFLSVQYCYCWGTAFPPAPRGFCWHHLLTFAVLGPTAIFCKVLAPCSLSVHQFPQHLPSSWPGHRDPPDSPAALHELWGVWTLSLVHLSRHQFCPFLIRGPEGAVLPWCCWTWGPFRAFMMCWEAQSRPCCPGTAPHSSGCFYHLPRPLWSTSLPHKGRGRKSRHWNLTFCPSCSEFLLLLSLAPGGLFPSYSAGTFLISIFKIFIGV